MRARSTDSGGTRAVPRALRPAAGPPAIRPRVGEPDAGDVGAGVLAAAVDPDGGCRGADPRGGRALHAARGPFGDPGASAVRDSATAALRRHTRAGLVARR